MCVTSAAEDLIYLLYVDDWGLTLLFPFLSEGQSPEKGSFFLLSAGNSWNWGKQNTASAGVHSLKMSRLLKSLLSLAISGPACQTKNQPLNLLPFFTLCSVFEGLGNKTPITKTWPKTCSSEASHKIQGLLENWAHRWTTKMIISESSGSKLLLLLFSNSLKWFASHLGKRNYCYVLFKDGKLSHGEMNWVKIGCAWAHYTDQGLFWVPGLHPLAL